MRSSGQSLTEYSLVIGLVILGATGGLMLLGQNVSTQMQSSLAIAGNPSPLVASSGNNNLQPLSAASGNPFANFPGKTITLDLGEGRVLNLNYANPPAVAESVGGNGVTENALAALDQMIAQLKTLDPDNPVISDLVALSKEGHSIKFVQRAIEAKFPAEGFPDNESRYKFVTDPTNTITLPNGQVMTMLDAMDSLSFNNGRSVAKEQKNALFYRNADYQADLESVKTDFFIGSFNNREGYSYSDENPIARFINQVKAVEANAFVQSHPALKTLVVETLSQDIYLSSNHTHLAPNKADVKQLAETTRENANQICTQASSASCQDR